MAERLRIGVIGLSHDHIWDHMGDLTDCSAADYVGAADADVDGGVHRPSHQHQPTRARAGGFEEFFKNHKITSQS